MAAGFAIGTSAVLAARRDDDGLVVRRQPLRITTVHAADLAATSIAVAELLSVTTGAEVHVGGTDAARVADLLGARTETLSPERLADPDAPERSVFDRLVAATLGDPDAADEALRYARWTTAENGTDPEPAASGRRVAVELGYDPEPIHAGLAVLYDGSGPAPTGLGIALEEDVTSVCLADDGDPAVTASVDRGGEWVDERAAAHCGVAVETVAERRREIDLDGSPAGGRDERAVWNGTVPAPGDPEDGSGSSGDTAAGNPNRTATGEEAATTGALATEEAGIPAAVRRAYEELVDDVVEAVLTDATTAVEAVSTPVTIGGSAAPDGIDALVERRLDGAALPFARGDVSRVEQPADSVVRGALAAAACAEASPVDADPEDREGRAGADPGPATDGDASVGSTPAAGMERRARNGRGHDGASDVRGGDRQRRAGGDRRPGSGRTGARLGGPSPTGSGLGRGVSPGPGPRLDATPADVDAAGREATSDEGLVSATRPLPAGRIDADGSGPVSHARYRAGDDTGDAVGGATARTALAEVEERLGRLSPGAAPSAGDEASEPRSPPAELAELRRTLENLQSTMEGVAERSPTAREFERLSETVRRLETRVDSLAGDAPDGHGPSVDDRRAEIERLRDGSRNGALEEDAAAAGTDEGGDAAAARERVDRLRDDFDRLRAEFEDLQQALAPPDTVAEDDATATGAADGRESAATGPALADLAATVDVLAERVDAVEPDKQTIEAVDRLSTDLQLLETDLKDLRTTVQRLRNENAKKDDVEKVRSIVEKVAAGSANKDAVRRLRENAVGAIKRVVADVEDLDEQLQRLEAEFERAETDHSERLSELATAIERLSTRLDALERWHDERLTDLERTGADRAALADLAATVDALDERVEGLAETGAEESDVRNLAANVGERLDGVRSELRDVRADVEATDDRSARLREDLETVETNVREDLSGLRATAATEGDLEAVRASLEELRARGASAEDLRSLREEVEQLRSAVEAVDEQRVVPPSAWALSTLGLAALVLAVEFGRPLVGGAATAVAMVLAGVAIWRA